MNPLELLNGRNGHGHNGHGSPPPSAPAIAEALDGLARFLALVDGARAVSFRLEDGRILGLVVETPRGPGTSGLSFMCASLLDAADGKPQTAKALARKAGYTYGAHVRRGMAELVRARLLVKTPDGYERAE